MNEYLVNPKKMIPGEFFALWRHVTTYSRIMTSYLPLFSNYDSFLLSGTKMVFAGLKKKGDRKNLIAFLKSNA